MARPAHKVLWKFGGCRLDPDIAGMSRDLAALGVLA